MRRRSRRCSHSAAARRESHEVDQIEREGTWLMASSISPAVASNFSRISAIVACPLWRINSSMSRESGDRLTRSCVMHICDASIGEDENGSISACIAKRASSSISPSLSCSSCHLFQQRPSITARSNLRWGFGGRLEIIIAIACQRLKPPLHFKHRIGARDAAGSCTERKYT